MTEQSNTIVHIKLTNDKELFGILRTEMDEQRFIIDFPMEVIETTAGSSTAIKLSKYLPYSSDQRLYLESSKAVSVNEVSNIFKEYYYNSIHFQMLYIEPQIIKNMEEVNMAMYNVLSEDNQAFITFAERHNVDLTSMNQNKPN